MMILSDMGKSIRITGQRLQELRVEQALALRALGERSGVAYDTINKLELGRRPAHASTIRKLADALGVEPSELMKGEARCLRQATGSPSARTACSWHVHHRDPGRPEAQAIYGRKYKEVEKKLAEAMGDAASGLFFDADNLELGEYLDRWLVDSVADTIRPTTFERINR